MGVIIYYHFRAHHCITAYKIKRLKDVLMSLFDQMYLIPKFVGHSSKERWLTAQHAGLFAM